MKKNALGSAVLLSVLIASMSLGCRKAEPDRAATPATQAPAPGLQSGTPPPASVAVPAPEVPAGDQPAPGTSDQGLARSTTGATKAGATNRTKRAPVLRAVRSGRQSDADRLVFEFDTAGLPAWQIEYVDPPVRDCGSGDPVPVAGSAWLQVRFTGAHAHTEQGKPSSGPRRRALSQKVARELVRICDFEGEVIWVIGVARPNPYTARAFSRPSRLVIDIAH